MHTKHSTLRSDYSFATVILAVALALGALLAFPQMARADEPVKEGVPYRIVSVSNPSVVAQFDADEPTVGEKGTIDAPDNTAGQVFTFAAAGDGSYYIRSYYNPALLLTADSLSVRGGVSARYATAGAAQTWKLVAQADGTYHIVSTKNTTYMLDTSGAVTQKGASLIMWFDNSGKTQKWTLQEVDPATVRSVLALPASGSTTSLVSVSNPNVAVQVDGSQVGMAAKADSDAQRFRFDLQADGTYRLSGVVNPDLFLTADSLSFRGAVTAVPGNASKAQNWILERQADGTWHLLSSSNSYYMLDTSGATTAVGASCIMWGNNNGATQKWTLGAASSASSGSSSGSSTSGSSSGSTAPASNLPDSSNGTLYRIVNVANPNVAVQYEGSVASGVKAVVASIANTNRQYFSITLENGSYVIRSAVDNSVVLASAKNDFRGAVRGETASGSAMQTWKIEPVGSGNRFHIVSGANSTWMLDTNGSYPVSGAACIMWADNGGTTQMWTFQAVSAESASTPTTVPSGYPDSSNGTLYRIVSVSNPRVSVQANHDLANGGSVSMAATSSSDSQLFRFEFADDGTYRIVSVGNPGMYLTPGSFMVNGDVFTMAEGNGKSQRWTLEDTGNGQYHIICADDPSLMLDTSGSTTQAGARVIMWYDNGGKTQKWTIQAVSSSGSSSSSSSPSSSSTSGNSGNSSAGTMGTSVVGAGTIYRIVNVANPNVAVQINGSSPSSGASVSVAAKSTSALQLFTVGEDDNGTIYLRSVYNPALVLTANSLSVRGSVNAYYSTSGKAQTWVLKQLSDGTYHIVSASNSTYMLDTNGSYPNAGASCIMWFDNGGDTQKWTLEEVDASSVTGALSLPATDGTAYRITSVSNAGVVAQLDDDAPAAGEAANMAAPDNGANQAFTFELQPDGTYVIRNLANQGLLLTADSLTVRGGVSGQAASSSKAQRWIVEACAGGTYHLLSASNPTYMLDTSGSTTAAGSACIMWFDNGGNTQKWTLKSVAIDSLTGVAGVTAEPPSSDSSASTGSNGGGSTSEGSGSSTGSSTGSSGSSEPVSSDPVYTYSETYEMTILDMIRYQKSNGWFNTSTQLNDLLYAVNPDNFTQGEARFFQFLRLDTGYSGVTAEELDAFIASTSSGRAGKLAGMGYAFVEAAQTYGINEVYLLAHAIHESAWGTSTLAKGYVYDGTTQVKGQYWPAGTYYNFYGIGAVDSGPLSGGRALAVSQGWNSPEAAILGAAEWIADRYTFSSKNNSYMSQNTLYEMRWHSPYSERYGVRSNHQYATGTSWAYRIADIMAQCYDYCDKMPASAQYVIPVYSPCTIWRVADDWQDPSSYVMQWSELVTYTYEQMQELSDEQLFHARNEMFYCHGYDFDGSDGVTDAELQTYYEAKTWPRELEGMAFTDAEIANLQTIERLEADRGSVYKDRGFHASDM